MSTASTQHNVIFIHGSLTEPTFMIYSLTFYNSLYIYNDNEHLNNYDLSSYWYLFFCVFSDIFLSVVSTAGPSSNDFKFVIEPEDTVGVRGQPLTLNCSAQYGQQTPEIHWLKDQVQLNFQGDTRRSVVNICCNIHTSVIATLISYPPEWYQCISIESYKLKFQFNEPLSSRKKSTLLFFFFLILNIYHELILNWNFCSQIFTWKLKNSHSAVL